MFWGPSGLYPGLNMPSNEQLWHCEKSSGQAPGSWYSLPVLYRVPSLMHYREGQPEPGLCSHEPQLLRASRSPSLSHLVQLLCLSLPSLSRQERVPSPRPAQSQTQVCGLLVHPQPQH